MLKLTNYINKFKIRTFKYLPKTLWEKIECVFWMILDKQSKGKERFDLIKEQTSFSHLIFNLTVVLKRQSSHLLYFNFKNRLLLYVQTVGIFHSCKFRAYNKNSCQIS